MSDVARRYCCRQKQKTWKLIIEDNFYQRVFKKKEAERGSVTGSARLFAGVPAV